ncbi:unnamed protein product [Rotaria sp. Silwood2]|nr:unnamed protein product [Rotaria sp. Silwood2]CAF2529937.1 unnamed protein product [Rotaria sp. Silwood2]CAF2764709.1 unnamed protein product [Rotaria sp. Silwood2]CAF2941880.1 unnamed protein product [Rotaria sp. Silwood2]CAF4032305.1 unnamed protein product [Rotaria sp. Silwood2]
MAISYTSLSQRERNSQAFFPNSAAHSDPCRFKTTKALDNPTVKDIRDILENVDLKTIAKTNRLYYREEFHKLQHHRHL